MQVVGQWMTQTLKRGFPEKARFDSGTTCYGGYSIKVMFKAVNLEKRGRYPLVTLGLYPT